MADTEFTFESEQILESQKKKKYIMIGAIIAAAAALIALGVVLIVRSQNKAHKIEEGVSYAYSWKENAEGAVELSMDRSTAPGYSWILQRVSTDQLKVSAPASQPAKRSDFSLLMEEPDIVFVAFRLQNGTTKKVIHEMEFALETYADDEGKLHRELELRRDAVLQPMFQGGEGTEHPYRIEYNEETNGLIVTISDDWLRTRAPRETQDPQEELAELIAWIEQGGPEEDNEESYRNPFTGEEISGEELRKLLKEHMDELDSLIADDSEPETHISRHEDWQVKSSNELVASFSEPIYSVEQAEEDIEETDEEDKGGNVIICYINAGGTAGTCEVTIRSDSAGAQLVLSLSASGDGSLLIEDHRLETFEPIEQEENPELTE